jgi:winged helix-turn helix protein
MPQGRTSAVVITLDAPTRALLELVESASQSPWVRRRACLVLLRADGVSISAIARTVGIHRRHIYTWLTRFQALGLEGLARKAGSGYPVASLRPEECAS